MPLYFQPRFAALSSVLALLFGGGWVALRRREREANDVQGKLERARSQMTHTLLERMAAASAGGDIATFFISARSAIQLALAARWQAHPEQISLTDVDARLDDNADQNEIQEIFALADEANYSGDDLKAADFERWTQVVRRQLPPESV